MLIVSNYHYIREDFSAKYPSIFGVRPEQFRKQLEELAGHGRFISQADLLNGEAKTGNNILITFDDGLKEQYDVARFILNEMGIPFVFFINSENFVEKKVSLVHKIHLLRSEVSSAELLLELEKIGDKSLTSEEKQRAIFHYNYDEEQTALLKYLLNFKMSLVEQENFITPLFSQLFNEEKVAFDLYFSEEMLKQLHEENALASHSHSHVPLGLLTEEEVKKELQQTQDFFITKFGEPARLLSYPFGSFEACKGVSDELKAAGFEYAFTMERSANRNPEKAPLLLSRFDCNDLPLGKNNLFKGRNIFMDPPRRKWHSNENSFTHQQ